MVIGLHKGAAAGVLWEQTPQSIQERRLARVVRPDQSSERTQLDLDTLETSEVPDVDVRDDHG